MHRLVIALTTLIGLTAAAYLAGYLFLFTGATDPAGELAPANTAVYVVVSLQPSSAQDANIARLASRLPGFADASALDTKLDELAQNLFLSQAALDYRRNVKPWLGRQVAIVMPPRTDTPPTLLVGVRERSAADEALVRVEGERGGAFETATYGGLNIRAGQTMAYAFVAETLVIGPDAAAVQAIIDVHNGAESLADRSGFAEAMAALPADRLAAAYLDLEAFLGDESRYPFATGALLADPDGLVARGRSAAASAPGAASGAAVTTVGSTLSAWMPADTQVAITAFDASELLFSAERILSGIPAADGIIQALETARLGLAFGLGIDLDDLLTELMRGEAGVALRDLDTATPRGQLLLRPDDVQAVTARLAGLADLLDGAGASVQRDERPGYELVNVQLAGLGSLAYAITDEVVVLGLDPGAVEAAISAHASGLNLASLGTYGAAFDLAGVRSGNEVFMDPRVLLQLLGLADALPADARDILEQLGALAVTLPDRGDHLEFHAVLTVD